MGGHELDTMRSSVGESMMQVIKISDANDRAGGELVCEVRDAREMKGVEVIISSDRSLDCKINEVEKSKREVSDREGRSSINREEDSVLSVKLRVNTKRKRLPHEKNAGRSKDLWCRTRNVSRFASRLVTER